jgi:hypothetical protein
MRAISVLLLISFGLAASFYNTQTVIDTKVKGHEIVNNSFDKLNSCYKRTRNYIIHSSMEPMVNNLKYIIDVNDCLTMALNRYINQKDRVCEGQSMCMTEYLSVDEMFFETCGLSLYRMFKGMVYTYPQMMPEIPADCDIFDGVELNQLITKLMTQYESKPFDINKLTLFVDTFVEDLRDISAASAEVLKCSKEVIAEKYLMHDERCYDRIDADANAVRKLFTHMVEKSTILN